jgi:cholesterol transport system auxiliary component
MFSGAVCGRFIWLFANICIAIVILTSCALPDKPSRPQTFDLGPVPTDTQPVAAVPAAPSAIQPLVLPEIEATQALDSPAMWYRLAFANAQVLTPYTQARWSMPPAQLLRQHLRQHLGANRPVTLGLEAMPTAVHVLRIELDEFSQVFDSATTSQGVLRLRATLLQAQVGGEKLLAQRSFSVQTPAPSADAAGGARALMLSSQHMAQQLETWMKAIRP